MQTKIFKILLDGKSTNTIPIANYTTIGSIKEYFEKYLLRLGKDPLDYDVKIYLDTVDKLDVNNTTRYDNISLNSVWNRITNGHIVLTHSPNYFKRLYTDVIYQIALKLDLEDLANLCIADKKMSRICQDDYFWLMRLNSEYGLMVKPENESWKEFFKNVKKYSKFKPETIEDLIKYGKYISILNVSIILNHITNEGLKYVPNLVILRLKWNDTITDEGLKYVPNLTRLDLTFNKNITDEGLKYVPSLTRLNLSHNEMITDEGLKYVPNLTNLNVENNKNITDEGLTYVPNLTKLTLSGRNVMITDEGLKYVPNLTKLNLGYNENITDEGLKHVPNLTWLNLDRNKNITNEGLKYVPNAELICLNI